MTFEDFVKQEQTWLKSGRMLWYVTGNISKDASKAMVEKARSLFSLIPADKDDLADVRCVSFKPSAHYSYEVSLTDNDNENSCLLSYFELGPEMMDLKTKLTHEVVM